MFRINKPYLSTPESGKNIEKEMSFIEHLEVLRRHVIRATIAVLVFMLISFMFIQDIYKVVLLSPSRVDFWTYKKLCELGKILHIDSLCVKQMNFTLMSREVSGQFMMSITSSAVIGLVFAFPYAFWEIWRFIKPGLSQSERNAARGAVFYVTFLFFLGITFGYFVVTPFALNFLVNFQIDPSILNQFDINSYISILVTLTLVCGITFQLPIAIFILSKIGVVGPVFLRTYRKHAFVIIMVVAAIVTPSPDIISQILVAIPLYILYEISIRVSNRVHKAKIEEFKE